MTCAISDSRTASSLACMSATLDRLEGYLLGFQQLTGVAPTGWPVVALLTRTLDEDTGIYTVEWPSEPNDRFQVQASHDGVSWHILDNVVAAAATPNVITTWESLAYDESDLPIYFQILQRPRLVTSCNGSPVSWPVGGPCGPTSGMTDGLL